MHPAKSSEAPAIGSLWRQPRSGRLLRVSEVDHDGFVWGQQTTRGGRWRPLRVPSKVDDFLRPDEDPLLDNLMGWRWVPVTP